MRCRIGDLIRTCLCQRGCLQFIFTVPQKLYTPSALFCCLVLKSRELLFFKFIMCSHLLLGLILLGLIFTVRTNTVRRITLWFSVFKVSQELSAQEISTWFSYSSTKDKHYLRGHRTPHLISSIQSGKNGFAAGPASCLSSHKGILDNSGFSDSTRHPCVGNCLSVPSPLSIWTKTAEEQLGCGQQRRQTEPPPLFSKPKIKAVLKSPDIATDTRKFWDHKK